MDEKTKTALKDAKASSFEARKILRQGNTSEARKAARKWLRKQGK